jgi:hypothetical protein
MPEISRFLGIKIKMFYNEHNPPHFHAFYGDFKATFSIYTGQMIEGDFPSKQQIFIAAWTLMHLDELMNNWNSLMEGSEISKIKPLE